MNLVHRMRRTSSRAMGVLRVLLVVGLFGTGAMTFATWGAVEYTAQSEFCVSCHIMEPYYASWEGSSHADVSCIECHYEPGAVETGLGKFKALSQLAKYATRTEGTKPWAEVSDASCMRSGCHSVRMLDGPVTFGEVAFDHRHHLLESRRGRRLRCVTCHSQNEPGEHVSVTPSVCFMCHFMPDERGNLAEETSDCLMCHGPPQGTIDVADRPFEHASYVARGVTCQECHTAVVDGKGDVRKERCHSCHSEIGHIERYGETAFMHEMHVTDHKVECFDCHDAIRHGLLPREEHASVEGQGCASCHTSAHDAPHLLYAGTGARGVEDAPSRMFQTRVDCEACHTGRSSYRLAGARGEPAETGALLGRHTGGPRAAAAGDVDCIHCHGIEYGGMVERWQDAVGGALEALAEASDRVGDRLASAPEDQEARELWGDARHNISLVSRDGSRGAHNLTYALDALAFAAGRLDEAASKLELSDVAAAASLPFRSESGCTECHAGVELDPDGAFEHRAHLERAALDCTDCHGAGTFGAPGGVEEHGTLTVSRADCTSCHHEENDERDVWECADCHSAQENMLFGVVEGFEETPGPMADMDCFDCHGDPPLIMRPKPTACVLCHEAGYDDMMLEWRARTDELTTRVRAALVDARRRGADAAEITAAEAALAAVERDGSAGSHNFDFGATLLEHALTRLEEP